MSQLIHSSKIVPCITVAAGAAASTALTGSTIDFAGYAGGLIVVNTGPIVTGAVTSIKFEHSNDSGMSGNADVLGTAQTIADDDDNEVFYIDISRPTKRYGRLLVSRGTQNATVCANAILYGSNVSPVTQAAGVTGETHVGKIAGTA